MIINDPFPKIIQGVVVASCRYQYHIVLFSLLSQVVCPEIDRNDHWAGQRRQSQCFIPRNNLSENSWRRANLSTTTVHHCPPLSTTVLWCLTDWLWRCYLLQCWDCCTEQCVLDQCGGSRKPFPEDKNQTFLPRLSCSHLTQTWCMVSCGSTILDAQNM